MKQATSVRGFWRVTGDILPICGKVRYILWYILWYIHEIRTKVNVQNRN